MSFGEMGYVEDGLCFVISYEMTPFLKAPEMLFVLSETTSLWNANLAKKKKISMPT